MIAVLMAALPAPAEPSPASPANPEPPADGVAFKPPVTPPAQAIKLPGLVINVERRSVDVEASVCLEQGALELIACTKDSKEHESIVVVEAKPIHIHTALLLLGARNGNPAMRKPINEEQTRWIDVPPQGDLIDVFLVFKDAQDKVIERPISDFITRSEDHADHPGAGHADAEPAARFPHTFIFAGSHLHGEGKAPRQYLADLSGNVISISTFGDELLCLPAIHSHENGALVWQIDSTHLPKIGSKVTLRLALRKTPEPRPAR